MSGTAPEWLDPSEWLEVAARADRVSAGRAMMAEDPGPREFAALLSPAAGAELETMAQRARALTQRHFGRTISLYVPLYLSNYCPSGCVYCGFASDRQTPRHKLAPEEIEAELSALKNMGLDEILLLTGERTATADYEYVRDAVRQAAARFHNVTVEVFPMSEEEYRRLAEAGCTGVTLYQETYCTSQYARLHLRGPKRDYTWRLEAPARALAGGIRTVGLGALLGLSEPLADVLCLYLHANHLRRTYWKSGVAISFPRVRPEPGGYEAAFPVDERYLAQIIFAFRICMPDVPLTLSTRESAHFRDGMAGVGISKMSVASRTSVGGYREGAVSESGQFEVHDGRDTHAFCAMLQARHLQPVFKNWDGLYREAGAAPGSGR